MRQTTADKFLKTLPLYNVTDKTADINKVGENLDVSRDTYGYAIGLKGLPLDYFYENYTDPTGEITSPKGRSKGLTSQTQVKRLKPQFRKPTSETVEQFKKDLGITPKNEANVYSRDIGQLLKGVAKVHSINAAISGAQRVQEAKLKAAPVTEQKAIKQQTADITAAQSKVAFSLSKKSQKTSLYISKLVAKIYTQNKLKALGLTTIPKGKEKVEIIDNGVVVVKEYSVKQMQAMVPGKDITWEKYLSQTISNFLNEYPQYYDHFRISFTGSVKRTAYGTVKNFEAKILTDNLRKKIKVFTDIYTQLKAFKIVK